MLPVVPEHPSRKLLVVDDEPFIRQFCVNVLDSFKVLQAADGYEALRVLSEEEIDIVLTDVIMPEIGGLELLQRIKQERPDQAVILMTGYSDKTLILEALKAGADDFIIKPIDILQLRATVEKVFEQRTLLQEVADLKHLDRLKNEFLGLISHKLKTPTTAISLFIQNLADGIERPDDENFKQIVGMVQTETIYLEKLIQDLLYFSEATLQEQDLILERTDLCQVAEQVAQDLQPLALTRSQQISVILKGAPANKRLLLNPQKIYFATRALLDNAIKFTGIDGTIRIECDQAGDRIRLSIQDNGIGIPASELSKIFNKFYQIDPEHTGHVRGFGLGLFYARDFIRSMGGQLLINSEPEQGTTAIIEFPLPQR